MGPLSSSSALGIGAGFLLPHALDPHPGNYGHQVPCIELLSPLPSELSKGIFPPGTACRWLQSRLIWEEPGSSLLISSLGTVRALTSFCLGGGGRRSVTTCEGSRGPSFRTPKSNFFKLIAMAASHQAWTSSAITNLRPGAWPLQQCLRRA
jgi:hypothetical protein